MDFLVNTRMHLVTWGLYLEYITSQLTKPVVHAAHKVPHAIKDKLKDELDCMVKLGVIVPVEFQIPAQLVTQRM